MDKHASVDVNKLLESMPVQNSFPVRIVLVTVSFAFTILILSVAYKYAVQGDAQIPSAIDRILVALLSFLSGVLVSTRTTKPSSVENNIQSEES